MDAAERDPELAKFHAAIQAGHFAPLRKIITRAIDRGELSSSANIDVIAATLFGALFYRRCFARESLDESFLQALTQSALNQFPAS